MNLKPEQKKKLIATYPELASFIEQQDTNTLLRGILKKFEEGDASIHAIKGIVKGDKGEDGYTPVKGKDYFTQQEVNAFLFAAAPRKGTDYFTEEDIQSILDLVTPTKGIHYRDGSDGINGKDGVNGKDGTEITPQEIANRLNILPKAIKSSTIDGILTIEEIRTELTKKGSKNRITKQDLDMSDLRWHGGGLSSVAHDATLTGNGTTSSPLSVVPSGATGYQAATGTVNGVNTIFVFTTAPNAIVRDGVTIRKTSSDGTVNWTGTTTVTLAIAPNLDVFAVA